MHIILNKNIGEIGKRMSGLTHEKTKTEKKNGITVARSYLFLVTRNDCTENDALENLWQPKPVNHFPTNLKQPCCRNGV